MAEIVSQVAGCALIAIICGWAMWGFVLQIKEHLKNGTSVDSSIHDIDYDEAPGLYWMQLLFYVVLILIVAVIGISMVAAFIQFVAGSMQLALVV
jgi:hypothetical protein